MLGKLKEVSLFESLAVPPMGVSLFAWDDTTTAICRNATLLGLRRKIYIYTLSPDTEVPSLARQGGGVCRLSRGFRLYCRSHLTSHRNRRTASS